MSTKRSDEGSDDAQRPRSLISYGRLPDRQARVMRWRWRAVLLALTGLVLLLSNSCASAPPAQQDNLCAIFEERPKWLRAAVKSERKWGIPVPVQMAFVQRESSFDAKARPPRKRIFGIVPWKRPSSAYGYAQALDGTWDNYKKATRSPLADRNNFADALDFIGWYNSVSHRKLQIAKGDAYHLYLAYHEGQTGYARGTFRGKPVVAQYARKVADRTARYTSQFSRCRKRLERKRWWRIF